MNIADTIRQFSADQYAFLLNEFRIDRTPFPLQIQQTPKTEDEAHRLWSEFRATLNQDDPFLTAMAPVLTLAQDHVAISGGLSVPSGEPTSPGQLRIRASFYRDEAVVMTQMPSLTAECGADVYAWYGPRSGAANQLAAAMPPYPAGKAGELIASTHSIHHLDDRPISVFEPPEPAPEDKIRSLLRRTRVAEGWIEVTTAAHGTLEDRTGWIDLANDGRYLVRWPNYDLALSPAGPADVEKYLQSMLPG